MSDSAIGMRRRRAARRLGFGATVLVAALGGAGAFVLWGPAARQHAAAPVPVASSPASAQSSSPPAGAAGIPAVLPAPQRVVQGVPVGYPHTAAGAISAGAHYMESVDVLSPDTLVSQLKVMAASQGDLGTLAGTWGVELQERRQSLGLPPTGTSDGSDFVSVQAGGYQIVSLTADRVQMWLLASETTTLAGVQHAPQIYTLPVAVQWADGDWKLAAVADAGPAPASATPDTQQAQDLGWTSVAYAN